MKKLLCIFTFTLMAMAIHGQENTSMETFDPAFVHTVFFWLNNPDDQNDRQQFEAALKKFLEKSGFAKTNFIGMPPKASRDVVDGSFTYSLVVTFESSEAQEKYQKEQPHLDFIEEASQLWNKVIVYDSRGIPQ
jgi:hypothetical protein